MEDDAFSGFELDDGLVVNLDSIRLINRNYWNYYFYAIDRYGQKGLSGIACHKNHAIEIMKLGDNLDIEGAKLFDVYSALFIMYYYCGIKIDGHMKKKADVYSFFMGELDDDSREKYCKLKEYPSPKEIFLKIKTDNKSIYKTISNMVKEQTNALSSFPRTTGISRGGKRKRKIKTRRRKN
jgi:hypothetical protein